MRFQTGQHELLMKIRKKKNIKKQCSGHYFPIEHPTRKKTHIHKVENLGNKREPCRQWRMCLSSSRRRCDQHDLRYDVRGVRGGRGVRDVRDVEGAAQEEDPSDHRDHRRPRSTPLDPNHRLDRHRTKKKNKKKDETQ
jgi:hypothetical protein